MHKGEIMANIPEINITNQINGLELSENSGVVNELLRVISAQAGVIRGLNASDVRGVLDNSKNEPVDITDLRKAVEKNHQYEIRKFSELKRLIDGLRENSNVNPSTLDAMLGTVTSLEDRMTKLESSINTRDMSTSSIDAQSKAIEKLTKQLSNIEKAVSNLQKSGDNVQNNNGTTVATATTIPEPANPTAETKAEEVKESNVASESASTGKEENQEKAKEVEATSDGKGVVAPVSTDAIPKEKESEPANKKDKKIKLVRKAMDEARLLSEPKMPWYKRMFNFANRHPVLTTLAGAGIGLGVTLLTGPLAYLLSPTMTLVNFINRFAFVLGGGAVVGLGAGILTSAFSGRVMRGKKGRLYGEFNKYYKKCASIEKTNEAFETMINLSQEKAKAMDEKAKNAKGFLKGAKKFAYRKARNFNLKASRLGRVFKARNQEKYKANVEKALEVKLELNARESTPNRRGNTKSMAIAGYMEKKKKLDRKKALGKMSDEEYAVRLEDLDYDVSELKGGEAGLSKISNEHRTFDKEAYELINSVKGNKSSTMQGVLNDIQSRQGVWEEYEEKLIDQAEAKRDIEKLKKAGKDAEAKMIEDIAKAQAKKIDKYVRATGKAPEITEIEVANDSHQM